MRYSDSFKIHLRTDHIPDMLVCSAFLQLIQEAIKNEPALKEAPVSELADALEQLRYERVAEVKQAIQNRR